jgi:ABC-type phosphate transport system substrate-binding protein
MHLKSLQVPRPGNRAFLLLLILALLLAGCGRTGEETAVAASNSEQRAIQNKGSDTLVNVALAWAEAYREVDPTVSIAVTGGGSGTGIAALINGTVDIANASRAMKDETRLPKKPSPTALRPWNTSWPLTLWRLL